MSGGALGLEASVAEAESSKFSLFTELPRETVWAAPLLHKAVVRFQSFQLRFVFYLQNKDIRSGPDETRTRDLCHAKAALYRERLAC